MKNYSFKSVLVAAGLSVVAFSPVFGSEAEDEFKRMDTNGDGKVTTLEYSNFAEVSFNQTDADKDGRVSAAECESSWAVHHKKIDKNETAIHMRMVDTDGDGQISAAESAAYAKSSFARADKNSDGVLSEDEVEKAHHEMKKALKK